MRKLLFLSLRAPQIKSVLPKKQILTEAWFDFYFFAVE
jgi:hypothetical protein